MKLSAGGVGALVLLCAWSRAVADEWGALNAPTQQALAGVSRSPFAEGRVFIVPSSHQDIGWMDTPRQCAVDRDRSVITPALQLLQEHPDYRIAFEAAYMLHEYLQRHPERKQEILRYTREGRLTWGATYVEPYESSYSGESLVRGLYFGRRWLRQALPGCDTVTAWNPDVPARSLQMQQILHKAGVKYLVISRHERGMFRWVSPDGTGVIAWSPGHYVDFTVQAAGKPFPEAAAAIAQQAAWWQGLLPQAGQRAVLPLMATTDMSGPQSFYPLMERWGRLSGCETPAGPLRLPAIQHGTDREALDAVMAGHPALHDVVGERPNVWLYIHGPAHHWALSAAREAAVWLTTAEKLSTAEALLTGSFAGYPQAELSAAWKSQIHPDHGWGGYHGDETDEVFRRDYERARDEGRRLAGRALRAIAGRVRRVGAGTPIVVFNALSWRRSDPVEVPVDLRGRPASAWRLTDPAGHEVPFQTVSSGPRAEVDVALASEGSRATASSSFGAGYGAVNAIDGRWAVRETDKWNTASGAPGPHWLVVDFGRPRGICRVVVRHEGVRGAFGEEERYNTADFRLQRADASAGPWTDLVPPVTGNRQVMTTHRFPVRTFRFLRLLVTRGTPTDNSYARIYEVEAYERAPRRVPRIVFVARDVPPIGCAAYALRPVGTASLRAAAQPVLSSPFYRVSLAPGGIRQIRDLQLRRDLLATDRFLGAEVFTMQSVGNGAGEFAAVQQPTMEGFDRLSRHAPAWTCVERGPVRTAYALECDIPHVRVRETVTLYQQVKRIDIGIDLLGWDGDKYREFRVALPLALPGGKVAYQVPFGTVQVGRDEIPGAAGERYVQPCKDVRPREVQDWIAACDQHAGVTLSSDVAVCDYVDPTPHPSAYPILQPVLLASRKSCHGLGNWYLQPGDHHYSFSLTSYPGGWRTGHRAGIQACEPLLPVVAARRAGGRQLPARMSFCQVDAPNVVVSTLKKAEDDNCVVARVYDAEGRDAAVGIRLFLPVARAAVTDIIEERAAPLPSAGGGVRLRVGHHAIETLKLYVAGRPAPGAHGARGARSDGRLVGRTGGHGWPR